MLCLRMCLPSFIFYLLFSNTPALSRELHFDESQIYYELLFEAGLGLMTDYSHKKYRDEGAGRTYFPTQKIDDHVSTWFHGNQHSPNYTKKEQRYNLWSDNMQTAVKYSSLLSPLAKPAGHRLGSFMTILHAHNIWSFFTYLLKFTVERKRPKHYYLKNSNSSNTLSFPSGHTGRTFVMVSIVDRLFDMPTWSRIGIYSIAGSVAVLRMASDKHFFSDVTAAMGIAYFSSWLSYSVFESSQDSQKSLDEKKAYKIFVGPSHVGLSFEF